MRLQYQQHLLDVKKKKSLKEYSSCVDIQGLPPAHCAKFKSDNLISSLFQEFIFKCPSTVQACLIENQ